MLFDKTDKIDKKWYEESIYKNLQYFTNASKSIDRKADRGKYPIRELLKKIIPRDHKLIQRVQLSKRIPLDLIPYGRMGDAIDRDYTFYRYAKEFMENNCDSNTLYINYTGHAGPVAAVLAEHNIPTYWQMDLSTSDIAEDRIVGQIQDYIDTIAKNNGTNNTNMGLILEPPHGFQDTIINENLPSAMRIKQQGIKNVIIFTEDPYIGKKTETAKHLSKIISYIKSIEDAGVEVKFVRHRM